jgi:beta-glucosidase
MPRATFHFPRNFLWGTATSSHQVEGNNTRNTWWVWEQEPGRIVNGDKSGAACDWWGGRWREDFDRAAESSQNSHRLSVEWSRIQPEPDRWDEDAIDNYREMVRGLRDRGMTPLVTLHHFSDPLWLAEAGGWEESHVVQRFEAYARKIAEAFREYASLWITVNEPNVYVSLGYLLGMWPPGKIQLRSISKVVENMVSAHAAAYQAIHSVQPAAMVGVAHHYLSAQPAKPWFPLDRFAAGLLSGTLNDTFPRALKTGRITLPFISKRIPEVANTQDFLGINYYTRALVAFNPTKPKLLFTDHFFRPGVELSENKWIANEPEGLFEALNWARKFELPMIITENGVEDSQDILRSQYMIQHIHQVWRAVNFNWPVQGYFWWSLLDNFEWERGWTQRFGLWELDIGSQARRKRPSADLYAEICRENGISSGMVQKYAPKIYELMFP